MLGVTTAIIQDKRIKRKDGTFAIKLRITFNRDQKYFPLGKHLTVEEWEACNNPKVRNAELKRLKLLFSQLEKKASILIDEMDHFTFDAFEKEFNEKPKAQIDIFSALDKKRIRLKDLNRLTSSESYQSTLKSLKHFGNSGKSKKLRFSQVTPDWLFQYEKWMLEKGKSITTLGIYLRNLRTIFNEKIEEGTISRDQYPFGKRKYIIPSGVNKKKALTLSEIEKVFKYEIFTEAEAWSKDMWIFSYLCNGINVKDIAFLKFKNIGNNSITFVRSKTKASSRANQAEIQVFLNPEIKRIIKKWGSPQNLPDKFVFSILEAEDSPERQLAKIKQATKTINKYMKRIGEALEFDMPLTTYTARHSFATVLKRSGAPIEFISESLGHKDLKTTENYLDSFEDETREKYQRKLLDFS